MLVFYVMDLALSGKLFCTRTGLVFSFEYMTILLGEAVLPFSCLSPVSMGSTLKGKNLVLVEQILSFKIRPHLGGEHCPAEEKRKYMY